MCLGEGVEVSVCLVVVDFCGLWGLALDILPIPIGGATYVKHSLCLKYVMTGDSEPWCRVQIRFAGPISLDKYQGACEPSCAGPNWVPGSS